MLHVTDPAELLEFSVELSITGEVDLYFSIHEFSEDDGCFDRLIEDVVVPVTGHGRDFYSSGPLTDSQGGPLFLDPGGRRARLRARGGVGLDIDHVRSRRVDLPEAVFARINSRISVPFGQRSAD